MQPLKRRIKSLAAWIVAVAIVAAVTPVMGQLLGQSLFPTNSPWNQDISSAPIATNSASIISAIGSTWKIHPDWGNDSPTDGNSTARISVIIDDYADESDIVPAPIPTNAVIEGDYENGQHQWPGL